MSSGHVCLACQCGATLVGHADPVEVAVDLSQLFWLLHRGEGHGATTLQKAATARRRAERQRTTEDGR